jgi:hypothetical protein
LSPRELLTRIESIIKDSNDCPPLDQKLKEKV